MGGVGCDSSESCVERVTALDTGMRRLNYHAIVRLRVGDLITCVVPAINKYHHDLANDARELTRSLFRRALLVDRGSLNTENKKAYTDEQFLIRSINRDGKYFMSSTLKL